MGNGDKENLAVGVHDSSGWYGFDAVDVNGTPIGCFQIVKETFDGITYTASRVKPKEVTDGLSRTYMVGEKHCLPNVGETATYNANPTGTPSWKTGIVIDPGDAKSMYSGAFEHTIRVTIYRPIRDGEEKGEVLPVGVVTPNGHNGSPLPYTFGSSHVGGFNMVFCDGSVHIINYDIDPRIHRLLGMRADGTSISEQDF